MSPPELSGNTPIANIICPVEISFFHTLRQQFDFSIFYCFYCWLNHLIHLYKPLLLNHWLYRAATAVMCSYIMFMWYNLYKKTKFI